MNYQIFEPLMKLPVAINSSFGDAFQPSQWNDTINKLKSLKATSHKGPIMIGSKYIISDSQLEQLKKINKNLWLFIAITGLNESDMFSFNDYKKFYLRACSHFENVVCAIRPIINGQNDTMKKILPIIQLVSKGNKMLTYTGYRNPKIPGSPKYSDIKLFNNIEKACSEYGVTTKQKCSCIVSEKTNRACWVHSTGTPKNLELLKLLGYNFTIIEKSIKVLDYNGNPNITKGDISFIKMICESSLVSGQIKSYSEILSLKIDKKPLVATSSWFNWSRQTICDIDCFYCFANYNSKVRIDLPEFGTNPTLIIESLKYLL